MKPPRKISLSMSSELADRIAVEAKLAGVSKTKYIRRALESVLEQCMQTRMAELSAVLSIHSEEADKSMKRSLSDGLVQ